MGVVLISNRVANPTSDGPIEGGLASSLLAAVRHSGAIWIGSRVRSTDGSGKEPLAALQSVGTGAIATVELPVDKYRRYYEGFANSVLWPVLHSRPDLIHADNDDYLAYRDINRIMARALRRFLPPQGSIWVHDYHFLTLGHELRKLGVDRPIGLFLHTPFPHHSAFLGLPRHRELIRAVLDFDLVGFQTDSDRTNFAEAVQHVLGLSVLGHSFVPNTRTKLATFPIGIDAQAFAEYSVQASARPEIARLRASLQGAKLAIGVDRIDYSKGLENRLHAFDRLFHTRPELKRQLCLLQIALPSRGQIAPYGQLQTQLATLVSDINGRHGEIDWIPIRHLTKGFPQTMLAGLYRTAQVGLVTPLHDGMNLVAKEYVAAQNPLDPGVLVLSELAGAAQQLDAALLVNPHDVEEVGQAICTAMAMQLEERRERWETMMVTLERDNIDAWFTGFLDALDATRRPTRIPAGQEAALVPVLASPRFAGLQSS